MCLGVEARRHFFVAESLRAVLRGAKLVSVAEDIGGKLSFHDCTLLLTRRGRAPYLVGCVAQIVAARRAVWAAGSRARTR